MGAPDRRRLADAKETTGPTGAALLGALRADLGAGGSRLRIRRSGTGSAVAYIVAAEPGDGPTVAGIAAAAGQLPGVAMRRARSHVVLTPTTEFIAAAVRDWADAGASVAAPVLAPRIPVMVSIGCPNANKPLHLGHLRNCFFGMALAAMFEMTGQPVVITEEISDYGIHICEAAAGYQRWGGDRTPATAGVKPDHFVGEFYASYHAAAAQASQKAADLRAEAMALLAAMEAGDQQALALNERITEWAIAGIRQTYQRIGLHHDFVARELECMDIARQCVAAGLRAGICQQHQDGGIYIDLTGKGVGEVMLLRGDGTSLVTTRCVGVWVRRGQLLPGSVTVRPTGEHWALGFAQLIEALRALGHAELADGTEPVYHGMVHLADGKISSRQGTAATADALLDALTGRLAADWEQAIGQQLTPMRRETCARFAVNLFQFLLLGNRRTANISYREQALFDEVLPRYRAVLKALAHAEEAATAPGTGGGTHGPDAAGSETALRALLLQADDLTRVVTLALAHRDPAEVVTYLVETARAVRAAMAQRVNDRDAWAAVASVMHRALAAVAIRPPPLRDLPVYRPSASGPPDFASALNMLSQQRGPASEPTAICGPP